MPSSNKTTYYNLNKWLSTDKPIMSDFNSDNEILDSVINSHISNTSLHLTSDEKSRATKPYAISLIAGDGQATKEITFSFEPKLVIYCLSSAPFSTYDSNNKYNVVNAGVALGNYLGGSEGISLYEAKLTVTQTSTVSTGKNFINLNNANGQYLCIAFK